MVQEAITHFFLERKVHFEGNTRADPIIMGLNPEGEKGFWQI